MKKPQSLAFLLACCPALYAATPEETKLDTLKTYELQSVQVTSTRANRTTPMAFQNINKQQLKAINHGQDIPFLLSLTPSVITTSDAGNGIGYTSLRVRGTDPSRINITSNGIPMNDAESSQVFWVNMGDFASSISSMQIQRGVGTSTNGSSAFGATVNMETEQIGMNPFLSVDLSAGSYASHKETLRFGTGLLGGHWGIQGRLSNIGSDGYIDRASAKLNSYFVQAGYFADNTIVKFVTFNGTERTYHAWDYASKYDQSVYGRTYNPSGKMEKDANGNPQFYRDQTDNYHQQHYQLFWNQYLNKDWTLNVALHYTNGKGYYEQYKKNKKLLDYGLDANKTKAKSSLVRQKWLANDFFGTIASLHFNNKKNVEATIGGGWNKYDGDHYGFVTWVAKPVDAYFPYHRYYDNNTKKTDFNVYSKLNYTFVEGLNGFVDLQYRHVGIKMNGPSDVINASTGALVYDLNNNFSFFNPKFGVNYQINPNHRFYASYAISHREPVRNNYENNLNAQLALPTAERLNDLEVGYQLRLKNFNAGVNFYHMNYKDQFVLTGEVDNLGEAITRNFEKSYRMGVELEMNYKPTSWFEWSANATFSKNRVSNVSVTDDKGATQVIEGESPLSFSPSAMFNNILTFNYKGFKAMLINRYVGEQYLTNTGFRNMEAKDENGNTVLSTMMLKSYCVTDLDLSYNFSLKRLGVKDATFGVSFYNLFSAKYDNNGWAGPKYTKVNNKLTAMNTEGPYDTYAAGFAPSAPFNFMAHLSLNF